MVGPLLMLIVLDFGLAQDSNIDPYNYTCGVSECEVPEYYCARSTQCIAQIPECQLGDTFEIQAATATSARACGNVAHCSDSEYVLQNYTFTSNAICADYTTCASDQFQIDEPTPTSDRTCGPELPCASNQYVIVHGTPTSDRVCGTFNPTSSPTTLSPTNQPTTPNPTPSPTTGAPTSPTPAPTTWQQSLDNTLRNDGTSIEDKLDAHDYLGWIILGVVLLLIALLIGCWCSRSCADKQAEKAYAPLPKVVNSRETAMHTNQAYMYPDDHDDGRGRAAFNDTYMRH